MYSEMNVRTAINHAVDEMTKGSAGFYAPLMERFPLIVGEENMPSAVVRNLKAHQAPACTDGTNVYVDVKEMLNTVEMGKEALRKKDRGDYTSLIGEVMNILAHEYTHILCQHTRQGQKFNRDHKGKDIQIFSTACEIEANRGYLVSKSAGVYEIAVTEDTFPETREDKFLPQIFETLKANWGKDINNQSGGKTNDSADEQGEGEGEGVPDKSDENSDSETGSSDGGENNKGNQSKGENNESEQTDNNQSEGDEGTGTPEAEEDGSRNGTDGNSQADNREGDEGGDEKLSENQRSAIQRMLETDIAISEERMTAEDLLPHDESVEDDTMEVLQSLGLGGGDEGFLELSPAGKLKYLHNKWKAVNVQKELAKVKGVIKGTVSRERVKTYSRQSRKQGEGGLMLKGQKRASRTLPKILLAMDSSASMCNATMKQIASAIADIFDTCGRPTEGCYICKHTHRVSDVLPMKQWKKVAESFYASGGNDFTAVLEKAVELDVDVVLNVGDGQDYLNRDRNISKKALAKGIKWYDCNVVRNGYNRWASLVKDEEIMARRADIDIVHRTFIDLTGEHPVNKKGDK